MRKPKESILGGFMTVPQFTKIYIGKAGLPVTRQYIYHIRDKEKGKPGSTPLEFRIISGKVFVRQRPVKVVEG